jgi:hypothetical protein
LNWLRQAYELDPNGRAGELAFLLLMEKGFNTSPGCENGDELFREVVRRGTEHLRQRRSTDVEARVHFMMGDAYRDIVALAAGQHGDTYADSASYKPEEANARTKAVAEYSAGLVLDDKSDASSIAKARLRALPLITLVESRGSQDSLKTFIPVTTPDQRVSGHVPLCDKPNLMASTTFAPETASNT